jgi:MFS transporter, ACS family, D-galactonate transporter
MQGIVSSVGGLIGMRLGLGVCEAPCFPANSRVLATWFPQHERARANGVYAIGQYAGQGFLSIPLIWIATTYGWRDLFFIVGAIGVVYGLLWYLVYRDPQHSKKVNQAELDYIEAGGGLTSKGNRIVFSWTSVRWLMSQRQVIGASLAQFCGNSTLVFFLTWFPTYLVTERHMAYVKAGFALALPFIAGATGVFLGGILSDTLLKVTGSANLARKLPVISGLLLASVIIAANYVPVENNMLVIGIMSVAFFGQGLTNLGWTVISDIAPKKLIGLTGGIFNFVTNLSSILTPIVIGYALKITGTFVGPLVYTSVLALLGVCCYLFVIGDIKRLSIGG